MEKILIKNSKDLKGKDNPETWLRDYIYENPAMIKLGELLPLRKESENRNGSLDLLLSSSDKSTYFNVEIQLGNADAKHILKTLSYYKAEQIKYPHKKHFAVLIAESFEGQFLDAMRMIGEVFPYIAIEVGVYKIGDHEEIDFRIVMDSFTQREAEGPEYEFDKKYWRNNYPHVIETASTVADDLDVSFHTTKNDCIIQINNKNFFHFNNGKKPEVNVTFAEDDEIKKMIEEFPVKFNSNTGKNDEWKFHRFNSNKVNEYLPLFKMIYDYKKSEE